MSKHTFLVTHFDLEEADYGEPVAILRLLPDQDMVSRFDADEEIADPKTTEFVVVLRKVSGTTHICFVRGKFVEANWIRPFGRFSLPKINRPYPQLLVSQMALIQPLST